MFFIQPNRKFRNRSSERGSVLLMCLAFGAMLAITIVGLSTYLNSAVQSQKSRALFNEYTEIISSLTPQLEDPVLCADILGGKNFNGSIGQPMGLDIGAIKAKYGKATGNLGPGWLARSGGVEIQRIVIKGATGTEGLTPGVSKTVHLAHSPTAKYELHNKAYLIIVPRVPSINVMHDDRAAWWIPINFMVQNNVIVGCHGRTSIAAKCNAIGGGYDWGPDSRGWGYPANRCHPQARCLTNKIVTSRSDCHAPYEPQDVGFFGSTGGDERYICEWCNKEYPR